MSDQKTLTRRQFLRGTGGVTVALPLLPSLLSPREVQTATAGPPRLFMLAQKHGGWATHMELATPLPNRTELYTGHTIAHGPLPRKVEGTKAVVNSMLTADASLLTERLASKMNVLRGIDGCNTSGHNFSSFGNVCTRNPDIPASKRVPSIDWLAAWSPSYYKTSTFKERVLNMGYGDSNSWFHTNPASRSGTIEQKRWEGDPQRLFDQVFGTFTPPEHPAMPSGPPAPPLVDAVLENYKRLRMSNRRLSSDDRRRLDAHVEMLSELQRRASQTLPEGAGCVKPAKPSGTYPGPRNAGRRSPADSVKLHRLYVDIAVAAFKCGLTRVATIHPHDEQDPFSSYGGQWHSLNHDAEGNAAKALTVVEAYRVFWSEIVLDLVRKLDEDDGTGRTYLDSSLVLWTNESSRYTHVQSDKLIVTFGSAGGYFKTGNFVDYRNISPATQHFTRGGVRYYTGLPIHQFWANVLFALGIPRSEWDHYSQGEGTGRGYGPQFVSTPGSLDILAKHYLPATWQFLGNKLPVVT